MVAAVFILFILPYLIPLPSKTHQPRKIKIPGRFVKINGLKIHFEEGDTLFEGVTLFMLDTYDPPLSTI